jgi:hypothetical protein
MIMVERVRLLQVLSFGSEVPMTDPRDERIKELETLVRFWRWSFRLMVAVFLAMLLVLAGTQMAQFALFKWAIDSIVLQQTGGGKR